jgi:shikimate kinase
MNIVLIGFMGTGKSSVAPILADKLKMKYLDMDELIANKAGKNIETIFKENGEVVFREFEIAVAKNIRNIDNTVISTGGGIILNKINLDYLKENSKIVGLFASLTTILERINTKIRRPLFQDKEEAKIFYNFRKPLYEYYSEIKINTDNKTITDVSQEIADKFSKKTLL